MLTELNGKIILACAVFSLSLILIACSSGLAGKWVNPADAKDYYEFKSDGTWFSQNSSGRGAAGTYEVAGNEITMKLGNGMAGKATVKDNVMTTPDGKTYKKD